jgi:hypothetical protein
VATTGGQPGNQNAVRAKRWQQAIQRALARASNKDIDTGLDSAADKLVALALEGDKWALEELGDRIDGKPAQSVTHQGDEDGGPIALSLAVAYADPASPEG